MKILSCIVLLLTTLLFSQPSENSADSVYKRFDKRTLMIRNRFKVTYVNYIDENHNTHIIMEVEDDMTKLRVYPKDAYKIVSEKNGIALYPAKLKWVSDWEGEIENLEWTYWKSNKILEFNYDYIEGMFIKELKKKNDFNKSVTPVPANAQF